MRGPATRACRTPCCRGCCAGCWRGSASRCRARSRARSRTCCPSWARAAPRRQSGSTRFVAAVESALRQGQAEGVSGLVVDDLQFADAASVEAMQQLAGAGLGLRWIVAFRAHELAPAAQSFHDHLLDAHGARLQVLQPLAAEQVGVLIDSLGVPALEAGRLAPALARHTGGNPLFLLETLKLMLAAAPAGPASADTPAARLPTAANVAHLIGQRIERLSPMAVKLARCAAIAGADFSAELAAHVLGLRAIDLSDAWRELDAAQVLRDGAFAHDLIFEAARSSVPAPIARRLHAEMAGFLEAGAGRAGARRPALARRRRAVEGPALAGRRGRPRRRRLAAGRRGRPAAARRPHRPGRGPGPGPGLRAAAPRPPGPSPGHPRQPGAPRVPRPAGVARGRPAGARLRRLRPFRHPRPADRRRRRRGRGAERPGGDRRRVGPRRRRAARRPGLGARQRPLHPGQGPATAPTRCARPRRACSASATAGARSSTTPISASCSTPAIATSRPRPRSAT